MELKPGQIWKPKKDGHVYLMKTSEAIILLSRDREDDGFMYWNVGVFHFILDGHFSGAPTIKLQDDEITDNADYVGNLVDMLKQLS